MFLLASAAVCSAEPCFSNAERYISLSKVIIQFNQGVTQQRQESFFKQSAWLSDLSKSIRLQYPPVIIAKLNNAVGDYAGLKEVMMQLQSHPDVLCVNPVFKNGRDEVSVLREVYVKSETPDNEKLIQLAAEVGFEIIGNYPYDAKVFIIAPKKSASLNSLQLSCLLSGMNLFQYVHPNLLFSPVVTTNDPLFSRQWNLLNNGTSLQGSGTAGADMSMEDAWAVTRGDTSIKIAILDSGVDTLHPDLFENLLSGFDATGGGSKGYPNTNFANDGHGTACAGIVAAISENGVGVAGVAPLCRIIPVRIFYYVDTMLGSINLGIIPYSTTQWMADGINWAKSAGADVMSNSWGVPSFLFSLLPGPVSLAEDAIRDAVANGRNGKGTPMLFSTGNEDSEPIWPSTMEETIAVTATSMCDERKSNVSCDGEDWGGNYDGELDIAAPGVKITTTDMIGARGYSGLSYTFDFNGTSAACPNAAGVVALILSVNSRVKAWDAKYLLASTADKVGGYNYDQNKYAGTWSRELGFGRVNAYNAVIAALTYTGIKADGRENHFRIYPNPVVSRQFLMEFELQESSACVISVLDISGRIISFQTFNFSGGRRKIEMTAPSQAGIYLAEIVIDRQRHYQKLIVIGE